MKKTRNTKTSLGVIYCHAPAKVKFEFSHVAIFGGGPIVQWDGDTFGLRWKEAYEATWHELPAPSELQWKAFWLLLDQSGARNWDSNYANPDIFDGVGWGFKLAAPGLRIESSGSNAYPGSDSFESLTCSPFEILTTAVGILAGGDVHALKRHE